MECSRRITDIEPRPIRELNSEIPAWLCRVVERLMAKDAFDRFQSAGEVEALFEACVAHLQQPTRVALPSSLTERSAPERLDGSGANNTAVNSSPKMALRSSSHIGTIRRRTAVSAAGSILLGVLAWWVTAPADIAGNWAGELWPSVALSTVENADGWYSRSFVDDQGRRGAMQLEWSRLQRRYVERWKIGTGAAGSVTLRTTNGTIRGAISADAESATPSDMPRLRDFQWHRSNAAVPMDETFESKMADRETLSEPRAISIESPVKGRILRWGDEIREGIHIEEGEVIAEIQDVDPGQITKHQNRLAASETKLRATERQVEACKKDLASKKSNVASQKSLVAAYEQAKHHIAMSSEAATKSAKNTVEIRKAEIAEVEATIEQLEAEHKRNTALLEANIISELKALLTERKHGEAKAKLDKARLLLKSAEDDLIGKQRDQNAKGTKATAETIYAQFAPSESRR